MAADFEQVKQNIADTIYENGEELITGQVMQDRLLEMVSVTEEAINDVTIDPTVNVTVNNNTGTPSGSASFQNNQFSFEFSGIKGETGKSAYQIWLDAGHQGTEADFLASLQGNPGSNQDYPFELENSFNGGTSKALTAEKGKELFEMFGGDSEEVINTDSVVQRNINITPSSPYSWVVTNNVFSKFLLLEGGKYRLENRGTKAAIYALLTTDSAVSGETPDWLPGYEARLSLAVGAEVVLENIPAGTYLCFRSDTNNVTIPKVVHISPGTNGVLRKGDIADNLESESSEEVLSAKQGTFLGKKVAALEDELEEGYDEAIKLDDYETSLDYISQYDLWATEAESGNVFSKFIPLGGGAYTIKAQSGYRAVFAVLENDRVTIGTHPQYTQSYPQRYTLNAGQQMRIENVAGKVLYVRCDTDMALSPAPTVYRFHPTIKSRLNAIYEQFNYQKKLIITNWIDGYAFMVNGTRPGESITSRYLSASEYIRIKGASTVKMLVPTYESETSLGTMFMDRDGAFISGVAYEATGSYAMVERIIEVPVNAYYMRVAKLTSYTGIFEIEIQGQDLEIDKRDPVVYSPSLPDAYPRNAKIYITSELLVPNATNNSISPLTTSKNEVGDLDLGDVMMRFESDTINFEDAITISYQGNSTLNNPKKGFSVDLKNKHTFGNWLAMDSFHIKAYYIDWTHTRDMVGNRLLEEMYQTREKKRPYLYSNDFVPADTYKLSENRATCHIDGFPVQLYINDVFWGLYTVIIKKNLANYFLKKNNVRHIMFEPDNNAYITQSGWDWTKIEIRCPKKAITNMDGTVYDGDNPQEIAAGDVKTSIQTFVSWATAISASTTKAQLAEHIVIDSFVDWYLFCWMVDNLDIVGKNTLYTTWDGTRWCFLIYDLDNTFGNHDFQYGVGLASSTFDTFAHKANNLAPWVPIVAAILDDEIRARYAQLRDLGVFTVENIQRLFNERTTLIGADYYEKDLERWTYPSYGGSSANYYFTTEKAVEWFRGRLAFLDAKFGY